MQVRRIFFLYNNYEREHSNIDLICKKLETKNVVTFRGGITDKNIVNQLFRIRPHIIFTFPITTQIQVELYTMAKLFFHSEIITFTTEGLIDYHDEEVVKVWAGFYRYSPTLVDYHVYWGHYAAKYIGQELHRQNKVVGKHQIKVFGNPMYEKVYSNENKIVEFQHDERIKVLILTGFHAATYSRKDYIHANDIVNTNQKSKKDILNDKILNKYCNCAEEEKIYSEKYIQHIINAANKNPDVLFAVKLHPQEILIKKNNPRKINYLYSLQGIDNIQIIEESIPIGELMPYFKLLVHYGSTVDLEAYTYKVPTLKIEIRNVNNNFLVEANRLTESTFYADIDEPDAISKFIDELKIKENLFRSNSITEKQLYGYMNYLNKESYKPSMEIAEFLCSNLKFHKLKFSICEKIKWVHYLVKKYLVNGV